MHNNYNIIKLICKWKIGNNKLICLILSKLKKKCVLILW